jgi:hypothetical protein
VRAWRWYRDEEVQRPNKPLQQTKLRFAAEWQALGRSPPNRITDDLRELLASRAESEE